MHDISGFGLSVFVRASKTFPAGFNVTQFAPESDPFDVSIIQIKETKMGLNGDLTASSKASPISVTLNLIATSEDDTNMATLLEANRVGRGKHGARDVITMTAIYSNGRPPLILTEGVITGGMPANSVSSNGEIKSKSYTFAFENRLGAS